MAKLKKGLGVLGTCMFVYLNSYGFSTGAFEFDFDPKRTVGEHSKFTDEQKIAAALARLQRQCENARKRNAPKQMVIDAARSLVVADDEYKAQAHYLSSFFFYYPYARDGILFASGAATGALGFWLFNF